MASRELRLILPKDVTDAPPHAIADHSLLGDFFRDDHSNARAVDPFGLLVRVADAIDHEVLQVRRLTFPLRMVELCRGLDPLSFPVPFACNGR